jgi:hypothetical protein
LHQPELAVDHIPMQSNQDLGLTAHGSPIFKGSSKDWYYLLHKKDKITRFKF